MMMQGGADVMGGSDGKSGKGARQASPGMGGSAGKSGKGARQLESLEDTDVLPQESILVQVVEPVDMHVLLPSNGMLDMEGP